MKFPQETADLVTFIEEILNRKFHFWCSVLKRSEKNVKKKGKKLTYLIL